MIRYLQIRGLLSAHSASYVSQCTEFIRAGVDNLPSLLYVYWPLLAPVVGFLVFLYKNDGQVVLGDTEHHSSSTVHPAMLLHQVVAIFLIIFPLQTLGYLFYHEGESSNSAAGRGKKGFNFRVCRIIKLVLDIVFSYRFFVMSVVCGFIMEFGVLSHPFLLADNRHYMFYIWKRVLSQVYIRRMLAPIYAFMGLYVWDMLVFQKGILWSLVFVTALSLTLLPAQLTVRIDKFDFCLL